MYNLYIQPYIGIVIKKCIPLFYLASNSNIITITHQYMKEHKHAIKASSATVHQGEQGEIMEIQTPH